MVDKIIEWLIAEGAGTAQTKLSIRGLLPRPNGLPLKLHHLAEVADDELPIVASRIDVELVGDAARRQQLVQLLGSLFEAVVIVVADVEIDFHALQRRSAIGAGKVEDVVAVEIGAIEGR